MNPTDSQLTIGLDLGDRRHTVCVLSAGGDIVTEEVIVNTRACLEVFATRFPAATIVMETGTHSPWVSRLFEARGHRVFVANARKLRAISASHTKSDEEDARMPFDSAQGLEPVETARAARPGRSEAAQPGAPPRRGDATRARAAQSA